VDEVEISRAGLERLDDLEPLWGCGRRGLVPYLTFMIGPVPPA
jgi:hypothetical protein